MKTIARRCINVSVINEGPVSLLSSPMCFTNVRVHMQVVVRCCSDLLCPALVENSQLEPKQYF